MTIKPKSEKAIAIWRNAMGIGLRQSRVALKSVQAGAQPKRVINISHKKYTTGFIYFNLGYMFVLNETAGVGSIAGLWPPLGPDITTRICPKSASQSTNWYFCAHRSNLFILVLIVRPSCRRWNVVGAE